MSTSTSHQQLQEKTCAQEEDCTSDDLNAALDAALEDFLNEDEDDDKKESPQTSAPHSSQSASSTASLGTQRTVVSPAMATSTGNHRNDVRRREDFQRQNRNVCETKTLLQHKDASRAKETNEYMSVSAKHRDDRTGTKQSTKSVPSSKKTNRFVITKKTNHGAGTKNSTKNNKEAANALAAIAAKAALQNYIRKNSHANEKKQPRRMDAPVQSKSLYQLWKNFFFRRTGVDGCRVAGIMRMAFALLFLLDRYVWLRNGDMITGQPLGMGEPLLAATPWNHLLDLLHAQPNELLWYFYWVSVGQGLLLLLGMAPRLQVLGIFLHLVWQQRHYNETFVLDDEDALFRMWSLFLLFLPLHHLTIYDVFRMHHGQDDSWPMWPFRLLQVQLCLVYASSASSKWLADDLVWQEGTAMYFMTYDPAHFPGLWNPEFIFNRSIPSKLLCWLLLIMESTCWISVWVVGFKGETIGIMIIVHAFLELTTNYLCFHWLMIVGWLSFLVQPDYLSPLDRRRFLRHHVAFYHQPPRVSKGLLGILLQLSVCLATIFLTLDAAPTQLMAGDQLQIFLEKFRVPYLQPALQSFELGHGPWHLYKVESSSPSYNLQAFVQLTSGTVVDRRSPNWRSFGWWERKQSTRLMNFYARLASSNESWVFYCEYLAREIGSPVIAVELIRLRETPPSLSDDLSWYSPLRQAPHSGWESLMIVHPCVDYNDHCTESARRGDCSNSQPQLGQETCPKACGVCQQSHVTWRDEQSSSVVVSADDDVSETVEHQRESKQCIANGDTVGLDCTVDESAITDRTSNNRPSELKSTTVTSKDVGVAAANAASECIADDPGTTEAPECPI